MMLFFGERIFLNIFNDNGIRVSTEVPAAARRRPAPATRVYVDGMDTCCSLLTTGLLISNLARFSTIALLNKTRNIYFLVCVEFL